MAGNVDDVVHAAHDVEVAVVVPVARVAGEVMAGVLREVRRLVARVVVPERGEAPRRHRQADRDRADLPRGHLRVVLAQHAHVVPGDGLRRRARLHLEPAEAHAVGRDRPARLRLPPVVDDRDTEARFRPVQRVGIAALAREEQRAEAAEVVGGNVAALRILLLDRAERGGRREQHVHAVLGDEPPEGAGVRRADGLALVEDRRAALEERRVDDVRVADDPADVGRGPVGLARADAVDVLHGPLERDGVAAVVADDALRHARRPRRVEDVERIGRGHGHARRGRGAGDEVPPVEVAPLRERRRRLGPLEDHAAFRLVGGQREGAVEERLVRHGAVHLDAAGRGEDELRLGVVDALGELVRREAAEDDRVDRAEARAGEHRHHRLGDHRHVDEDAVALLDAPPAERAREARHRVAQLGVGEHRHRAGDGAVVDERALLAAPAVDMEVERVVAGVQGAADEPAVEGRVPVVEDAIPALLPVDVLGRRRPEALGRLHRASVGLIVHALPHREPSSAAGPALGEGKVSRRPLVESAHAIGILNKVEALSRGHEGRLDQSDISQRIKDKLVLDNPDRQ